MFLPVLRLFPIVLLIALVSCTRPPELVGVDNATRPVAAQKQATKRKVFIATTREATDVTGAFYSAERAPELGFASVVVSIPPTHVKGQTERPKRLPPNPDTEFAVIEPTVYGAGSVFVSQINKALAQLPPKDRHVLLFVHGYNNTISDSILRIAQFVEDTEFTGIPVLMSWASAAKTTHYVYDLNSVLAARPKVNELAGLLRQTNAVGVSVFAHSMGTMLLMEAIVQGEIAGSYNRQGRIDNVMLAAPDIDIDVFRSQLSYIPKKHRNFFIFVSSDDKALGFSRRISGGVDRVGASSAAELASLGVTVIDLSQVEDSSTGSHSKFAGSPEVVQLIGNSLAQDNFDTSQSAPTLVEVLGGVPVLRVLAE
jgi:esterase/lipase superfamily enzyme